MKSSKLIFRALLIGLLGVIVCLILGGCSGKPVKIPEGITQTPISIVTQMPSNLTTKVTQPSKPTLTHTPKPTPSIAYMIDSTATPEKITKGEPIDVSDANFETVVLQSELPIIVEFWAPWCGPCKILDPMLDKIADEHAGILLIVKVNTDEDAEWMVKYGIQGIPTMLFILNGRLIYRQVGCPTEEKLQDLVTQFLDEYSE